MKSNKPTATNMLTSSSTLKNKITNNNLTLNHHRSSNRESVNRIVKGTYVNGETNASTGISSKGSLIEIYLLKIRIIKVGTMATHSKRFKCIKKKRNNRNQERMFLALITITPRRAISYSNRMLNYGLAMTYNRISFKTKVALIIFE